MWAGCAAHSMLPLDAPPVLPLLPCLARWLMSRGGPWREEGRKRLPIRCRPTCEAWAARFGRAYRRFSMSDLPASDSVLFDVTPRQLLKIAGDTLPDGYRKQLKRYRYGPGVFKIDYALDGPVPWRAKECSQAATVHLGGTLEEIARSERQVGRGCPPTAPSC